MKFLCSTLICAAFILVFGNHGGLSAGIDPEPAPESTSLKPITSTSVKPNVTTSAPTTSTTTPPSTTPPTTTSPSTTPKPTTPTPTTTVKPTPMPTPGPGHWTVNGTNETCIIMKMTAEFNITYLTKDNKTISRQIILPSNFTTASGVCGNDEQVIDITWKANGNQNDSLVFHFVKNGTKDYIVHHIELYIGSNELPNITTNNTVMLIHNMTEYKIKLDNSYRCARMQRISLTSNVTNTTGILEVSDFQFQAFRTDKTTVFGYAEDCAVETQDVVPIVVGCALIILVVIVLVAYLIGRRRRQAGGYLSM